MVRVRLPRLAAVIALAAAVPLVAAAPVTIRLATLAPENSPWAGALKSMGAKWTKVTEGRVRLNVFAGTLPSESSAIARMAVDGFQAATLMVAGLGELDQAFNIFGSPFFFETDEELAHVQQKLTPYLAGRLQAKGYHLLGWGNGGWVRLFSKKPIRGMDDMKRAKIYTTEGDERVVRWYASHNIRAVPLPTGEIPKQLMLPTGAIDAAPSPPVFAVALQFFRDAPYMLDLRIGPLTGATVIRTSTWNRISADDQAAMTAAARAMEAQVQGEASSLDAKSIKEMQSAGLQVITLDKPATAQFLDAAAKMTASQRGDIVPAEAFDLAVKERDAYRNSKGR